jgi:signal transduction histidine kinase
VCKALIETFPIGPRGQTRLLYTQPLSQVITNYVTNALRYSSPDQPVQIGLSILLDATRLWVRDHGPGLSKEAQQNLWKRFQQVKGVPVLSGLGKGLGLYICQTLIEQHQGERWPD